MTLQSSFCLRDVSYAPGRKLILRGISLDIAPGQRIGILGPNGAGKSTLLRIMAAVLPASAGTVWVDRRPLNQWPAHERARRLAFVPQYTRLTFPFRAREVVLMGRTPYLRRWQKEGEADLQIVEEAMARTDTAHFAERDVTTLSGGEMQRVILARALAQQPAFLLLDEPTANLDLRHQIEILEVLTKLAGKGTTIIAALHDLNLAAAYCSTLLFLKEGEVYAAGPPATVLTPQTLRAVFGVDVFLGVHPVTGAPYIVPLRAAEGGTVGADAAGVRSMLAPPLQKTRSRPVARRPHVGKVYLVGAGPGDPGLLTLKGRRCLEEAEVVVYDYLVNPRILTYAHPRSELIYVGKKGGGETVDQEEINRLILAKAAAGKIVIRLKGGDPFLFGRGGEEAEAVVAAGIEFEVVPGVTSALAVPAYAGIPLTHRDYSSAVAIVTGHKEVWETSPRITWDPLAIACGTLVFLMGTRQLRQNMARLVHQGLSAETPVALVRWGTRAEQAVLEGTVGSIAALAEAHHFEPPTVVVVGEVVRLRQHLQWFEKKPLFGRRVLILQASRHVRVLAELFEWQGAEAILPQELRRRGALAELRAWLRAGKIDLVTFTRASTLHHALTRLGGDEVRELFTHTLIGCLDPVTAERACALGLRVDIQPAAPTLPAFVEAIVQHFHAGRYRALRDRETENARC